VSLTTDSDRNMAAWAAQLTVDLDAQRKALERVTAERDYWRTRYEQQAERIEKLFKLQEEARNG
jgi:hypothetical protein